jgi:hypothetical protein
MEESERKRREERERKGRGKGGKENMEWGERPRQNMKEL